jgi:hypothetical protein
MKRPATAISDDDDKPELSARQLALVLLPALGLVAGVAMLLWSRHGVTVWFDSAAAFLAGCFG